MKTIARTAFLGLLLGALQHSISIAADPAPISPPADSSPIAAQSHAGANPLELSRNQAEQPGVAGLSAAADPAVKPAGASPDAPGAQPAPPPAPAPAGNAVYDSMSSQPVPNNSLGSAVVEPFGPTFYLDGYFGRGVGWNDPSYQATLYYPWHVVPGQSAFFATMQAAVTNFSQGYYNGGVGYRQYVPAWERILGGWVFMDFDDTHNFGFARTGFSLESLGQYIDVRANWYVIDGHSQHVVSDALFGNPVFQSNNILVGRRRINEFAFDGGDLEIGGPLPFLGRYGISGYAGPYYVHSNGGGDGAGAQGRINVAVTDNFQVNVSIQDDPIFKMTTFVNVSLTLPDGTPTRWFKPMPLRDRLNSLVVRKDRIPVLDEATFSSQLLTNPKNNEPIDVIHVNPNLAAGTGDGTFEHPFGSLEQARSANNANVDIIRIIPRSDGTGTNLAVAGPMQLFNDQSIFGSSTQHSIVTPQGIFAFPGFTGPGALPLVSNANNTAGSSVFLLANRDQISGLAISGANLTGTDFGNGIGNAAPIVGFNLNQNQFTNYVTAVNLVDATGTPADNTLGLFANNATGVFVNNTMTGLAGTSVAGFSLVNSAAGTLDLTVSGNTATGNSGPGFLVETAAAGATINATFTDNTSSTNGTGYQFTTTPGTINVDFDGNTATGNTDVATGVHFTAAGGLINVTSFENNTVTNNNGNGVWFEATTAAGGGTIIVRDFQGNTITGNGFAPVPPLGSDPDGVLVTAIGGAAFVDAQIGVIGGAQNNISNNGSVGFGGSGVHFFAQNNNEGNAGIIGAIVNNQLSNNVGAGISIEGIDGRLGQVGTTPLNAGANPILISNNTISGNGDAGVFVRVRDIAGSGFDPTLAGVRIVDNSITGTVDGPSTFASGEGIHIRTESQAFLWMADIENNFIGIGSNGSILPNVSHGIQIESFDQSLLSNSVRFPNLALVTILNNHLEFNGIGTSNAADGINFNRQGDSALDNVLIQGNTIFNNSGNGINLFTSGGNLDVAQQPPGGLIIRFAIEDNTITNNGLSGINLFSTADAPLRVNIAPSNPGTTTQTISNNGLDGITAETQFFAQIDGTWQNNLITGNKRFGIGFTDADSTGPSFNVTVGGNTIQNNFSDGINYSTFKTIPLNNPVGTVNVNNFNLIKQNGGNGINVATTGAATVVFNIDDNMILSNTGDGVLFTANEFGVINSTSSGNTIQHNGGDGWSFVTTPGNDGNTIAGNGIINAVLGDNNISFNTLHGVNILNTWSGRMNITIMGSNNPNTLPNPSLAASVIDSNGLDGILVTNFVDPTLSQNDPVKVFNGQAIAGNNINLTVFQTEISGNGINAVSPDDGDGIFIRVGTSEFGAVTASLVNNHFSGNRNIDVVTQSFVATREPQVLPLFNNGSLFADFEPDPVARLNLHLVGNVGDEIDVTRLGAFYGGSTQPADAFKTIPGQFNDPAITAGQYSFGTADQTRIRNAQRDIVVDFFGGNFPEATNASQTSPNSVAAAPAPTASAFSAATPLIGSDGDYKNAQITVTGSGTTVITNTTIANQQITVGPAYAAAPAVGSPFFITAPEQAGVGLPTFLTDSGPSVNTQNTFTTVVSDFGTQVSYPTQAPFSYTWSFSPPQAFPQAGFPVFP